MISVPPTIAPPGISALTASEGGRVAVDTPKKRAHASATLALQCAGHRSGWASPRVDESASFVDSGVL